MLGATQSGCYSLGLSMLLSYAGYQVIEIDTRAIVTVGNGPDGYGILGIKIITNAKLDAISEIEFEKFTLDAKNLPGL